MTKKDYEHYMAAGVKVANAMDDINDPMMFVSIFGAVTHWYETKHGLTQEEMDGLIRHMLLTRDVMHKAREKKS